MASLRQSVVVVYDPSLVTATSSLLQGRFDQASHLQDAHRTTRQQRRAHPSQGMVSLTVRIDTIIKHFFTGSLGRTTSLRCNHHIMEGGFSDEPRTQRTIVLILQGIPRWVQASSRRDSRSISMLWSTHSSRTLPLASAWLR